MTDLIKRLRRRVAWANATGYPLAAKDMEEAAAALEAAREDKSDLEAALGYLKAHKENAAMNRDGIIKALSEVRDEQGAEIHRLRAELETEKGQAEFYRVTRNWSLQKAERLAEALRHLRNHTSVNSHQIELIDVALHPTAAQEDGNE